MTTQESIDLLTKYLEIKNSAGDEWSLNGESLTEALTIIISQVEKTKVTNPYSLTPPLRCFLIPGSKPELKGLEVAFDSNGCMGARCVANRSLGFILTSESAMKLSQLIQINSKRDAYWLVEGVDYFALACGEEEDLQEGNDEV